MCQEATLKRLESSIGVAASHPIGHACENSNEPQVGTVKCLKSQQPETADFPLDGIAAWRQNVLEFDPQTTIGERLRTEALNFLGGGQAQIAEGLGWGAAELFSVFNGTADTIARRVDAKGIVPFLALAPWPGTRVQAFAATHAVFITGTGGRFLAPKRAAPGSILFWDARGL